MRLRIILIIIWSVFVFPCSAVESETTILFNGNQLKLPHGFRELPKEQLSIYVPMFGKHSLITIYERSDEIIGLERIAIYYDSLTDTKKQPFDRIVETKLEILKERGSVLSGITIDKQHHFVFGKSILSGDTSVFGFSVDDFGMLGLQYDSSLGIHHGKNKVMFAILQSITYKNPYAYVPNENPEAKKAKKEMEGSGILMVIAFIVLITIWIIRKYAFNG